MSVDFDVQGTIAVAVYRSVGNGALGSGESKSKIAAGLLALFLGGLGIHKFYLGFTTPGVIYLVIAIFGGFLLWIPNIITSFVALIEAIIYLTKSDEAFELDYVVNKRQWF